MLDKEKNYSLIAFLKKFFLGTELCIEIIKIAWNQMIESDDECLLVSTLARSCKQFQMSPSVESKAEEIVRIAKVIG